MNVLPRKITKILYEGTITAELALETMRISQKLFNNSEGWKVDITRGRDG